MNDLKLLSEMRAEIQGRTPAEMTEARARMLASDSETAPRRHAAGRLVSRAPWRGRRALLSGVIATAAAAAIAIPIALSGSASPALGSHGHGPVTQVPAADVAYVLSRAAATARATASPSPRPDQYIYFELRVTAFTEFGSRTGKNYAYLGRDERREWVSADGSRPGIADIIPHQPVPIPGFPFPPPSLTKGDEPLGWQPLGTNKCPIFGYPTYIFLTKLPTDPGRLLAYMYAHADRDEKLADSVYEDVYWANEQALVPPKLRAALFEALTRIPGVTLVQHAVDAAGRSGIAVAKVVRGAREELIFERSSYRFLGAQAVVVSRTSQSAPVGTVVESTAIMRTAVADNPPAVHVDQWRVIGRC